MEDLNQSQKRIHKLTLGNRKTLAVTGVTDVLSFDIHEIQLETSQGMLLIKGGDLHVSRLTLDQGEVDVDGRIDSLNYSDGNAYGTKGESLFSRLFR